MSKVIVLGGGICGLASALMLARDGHDVTVLERDPAPPPESPERAWEAWERQGVVQFRQAHYMQPRGTRVLEAELPDVLAAIADAGAARLEWGRMLPPTWRRGGNGSAASPSPSPMTDGPGTRS